MTELIGQGLSNSAIAKALGLTRGQVLGKMRRLGLKTKNAANLKKHQSQKLLRFEGGNFQSFLHCAISISNFCRPLRPGCDTNSIIQYFNSST